METIEQEVVEEVEKKTLNNKSKNMEKLENELENIS